ncbi:MAG: FecR domain-containing protein [Oligoflexia bacterium]|nr:FecR domain-containing protein [Oligoflexia bacterium]
MSPLRAKSIEAALFAVLLFPAALHAAHPRQEPEGPLPCGVIEEFRGAVQIMDPSRTRLIEPELRAAIPCGGWISVGKGRVRISHRDGFQVHLSSNSFAQFPEPNADGKFSGDPVVLYRGQAYARAFDGARQLSVMTANGRVRVSRGAALVLFNQGDDQTQVVALEGTVSFENRFQKARQVKVAPGETSMLSFRQARVVPSSPKAIALAALRPRLAELGVGEKETRFALAKAKARADRKFAAALDVAKEAKDDVAIASSASRGEASRRAPASEAAAKQEDGVQAHLARRLAGGIDLGERLLLSGHGGGQSPRARLEIADPAEKLEARARQKEDLEKRKLIDELSRIRVD